MRKLTPEEKELIINALDGYAIDLRTLQKLLTGSSIESLQKVDSEITKTADIRHIVKNKKVKIYIEEA